MKISRPIIYLLILGLVIRIAISLFSLQFRENTDVLRYRDWGKIAYLYSLKDTYTDTYLQFGTFPNNQPPGSLYILSAFYHLDIMASKIIIKILHAPEGSIQWINGSMLNFFLRIPSILCDLLISYGIYFFIRKRKQINTALFASALFLFNPVIIYNSSFWGQMDSINNLFFLACLFSFFKKRLVFGLIFYALSLYIKLSLLFALPFILVILFKFYKNNIFSFLKSILITIIAILALTLPISPNPIAWITKFLTTNATGEMQNITSFAFNFWWFIFKPTIAMGQPVNNFKFSEIQLINSPLSQTLFFGISLEIWSYLLFTCLSGILLYFLLKMNFKKVPHDRLFLILSLVALTAFMFLPRMHERYMYPMFPLLAIACGIKDKFRIYYYIFSIISLINLYLVWHPTLPPLLPYMLMTNSSFQWIISAISVIIFFIFFTTTIKYLKYEKNTQ